MSVFIMVEKCALLNYGLLHTLHTGSYWQYFQYVVGIFLCHWSHMRIHNTFVKLVDCTVYIQINDIFAIVDFLVSVVVVFVA